jgi:hypothetical protein
VLQIVTFVMLHPMPMPAGFFLNEHVTEIKHNMTISCLSDQVAENCAAAGGARGTSWWDADGNNTS